MMMTAVMCDVLLCAALIPRVGYHSDGATTHRNLVSQALHTCLHHLLMGRNCLYSLWPSITTGKGGTYLSINITERPVRAQSCLEVPCAHRMHTHISLLPSCDIQGFELEESAHVTRIQILSHQTRIASKIELFIGDGPSYDQADFRRLGYLTLHTNERSNYQVRQIKGWW